VPRSYYREFWALKDISFEVMKGETVGIIGRNGSGKSTLLQIICGTLAPTSGLVETNGRVAALLELGSGFNPEFTGRENVFMNGTVLGLTQQEVNARFDQIVAFADIGDFIEQPVKMYSSGMLVRLAFAVIANVDADILVIDEALSVGDIFFVQKCTRFLRKFMERGTILFVTHDTGAVLNLCRTSIWLHNGQIAARGTPKSVTDKYLEKLYESQQGESMKPAAQEPTPMPTTKASRSDLRLDVIRRNAHYSAAELFAFDPSGACFGNRGILIDTVGLYDNAGNSLSWVSGGEPVGLRIQCRAVQDAFSPIVGFMVKDRLGQVVFGDNTYMTYASCPVSVTGGEWFQARFDFVMPNLAPGDYIVTVAVAEGTQTQHVQHHWIHEAIAFKVHSSTVCHGLIGVPMANVELRRL
jgi:lipopolysaccharide transport system ATP-binding protein